MSPRTAKPWVQPAQYVLSYPGANFPSQRISSALAWASRGNAGSVSQLLIKSGALALSRYSYN